MPANSTSFDKNWLFGLAIDKTGPDQSLLQGGSWGRWSLRWWGGVLLWLLLVLPAQAAVELRVAIAENQDAITIGSSTAAIIRNGRGEALYQLPQLQGVSLESDASNVDLVNNGSTLAESNAFWLEPADDGFVWIGSKWYRGRVMVTQAGSELVAINYVDLEDYLYSVVGSEMPTSWPQAALQSQAVAARSYALLQAIALQKSALRPRCHHYLPGLQRHRARGSYHHHRRRYHRQPGCDLQRRCDRSYLSPLLRVAAPKTLQTFGVVTFRICAAS